MAYGLRLRIEYRDVNEILTRINIYQDGWSGSADVRFAHAGVKIEWGDSGSENMPLLYGSSCTIFFDAEFNYEYLYLFSADAKKHLVEVEKGEPLALIWKGFIEPDTWKEPLVTTPYPVEAVAYDGLGALADVDFSDTNAVNTGERTLMEIIQAVLEKTGYVLTVNTAVEFREAEQYGISDWFSQTKINSEIFAEKSCLEVLEQLLQGCRIFQRNGEWWIVSNTNFAKSSILTFIYTGGSATPTSQAVVSLNDASSWWFEGEASMEMRPAIKRLSVMQDYGYDNNLVNNGSFDDFNADSGNPKAWILTGGATCEQRILNDDGEKFLYLHGKQKPSSPQQLNKGIYYPMQLVKSTGIIKFSLQYALMGALGESCHLYISITHTSTTGFQRYLWQVGNQSTRQIEYVWGAHTDLAQAISLNFHFTDWLRKYPNGVNPDKVEAYPFDQIQKKFKRFEISIPGVPDDGTLRIWLWCAYSSRTAVAGACFTGVSFEILDENEEAYPTTRKITITNNSRNNYVPDDIELIVGDVPFIPNNKLLYRNGFIRAATGQMTKAWELPGITTRYYTYAELIARIAASSQRIPRRNYQAVFADLVPRLNMILTDINNSNVRLIENGISYDDRMQAVEGQYTEVLSVNLDAGETTELITETTEGKEKTSQEKTATPAAATDEMVMIVGRQGEMASAPGYLHGDYFDFVPDEDPESDGDGKVRIHNRKESVDPYMLAFDAGVPQFSLRGAGVTTRYQGAIDDLHVAAGELLNHHYNALLREDIEKEANYKPERAWVIPEQVLTLPTGSGCWLYVQAGLADDDTTATLIVSADHIREKNTSGIITYKLGYIDVERNAFMLWGNHIPASVGEIVTQAGHGFTVGTAIRHDGSSYVRAQADSRDNAQVCGIVSKVIDAARFQFVTDGFLPGSWVAGG